MGNEIWKDIKGFEGLYQISNLGRVKSLPKYIYSRGYPQLRKEKLLKPCYVGKYRNYLAVRLNDNIQYKIHRLVAEAFIPNPNNLPCVNHKDENPSNNNVNNLEWCTYKYNSQYSAKSRLISIETKEKIRKAHLGKKLSEEHKRKIGEANKHSKASIIALGRIWINNGTISKMIYPEEFDSYELQGYIKGRLYERRNTIDKSSVNSLRIN